MVEPQVFQPKFCTARKKAKKTTAVICIILHYFYLTGMIGYGMAKAAVHHLIKSLALPKSGLPESATALAILPITLDTPMNRKWMPKADFGSWTPLPFVAE